MIKKILAVGDSFTYGEELDEIHNAYPYIIANSLNAQVVNQARPGSGNKKIMREVIGSVASREDYDFYIIGWSSPGRMEFADADGIFDIWPGYGGNMFRRDGQSWRIELLEYINRYHDPQWIYENYIRDILLLQNFLEQHNKKYVMLMTVANEYYHNVFFTKNKPLVGLINQKTFLGWPTEGMSEWTFGLPRGPNGHFLNEGHLKVAEKILEHLKNNNV